MKMKSEQINSDKFVPERTISLYVFQIFFLGIDVRLLEKL